MPPTIPLSPRQPDPNPLRPSVAFRTPSPVERIEITHPALPALCEGLTLLHLSDFHVRRRVLRPAQRHAALLRVLERLPAPDLIAITGDLMSYRGDEDNALRAWREVLERLRPRAAAVGVFGNHDPLHFRRVVKALPGVTWFDPHGHLTVDSLGLRLIGCSWPEDWLAAAIDTEAPLAPSPDGAAPFTIALTHTPACLPALAAMRVPLVLAGHTHGGQARFALPWNHARHWAPHNSCDLPRGMSSGLLRVDGTVCAVTRGIGTQFLDLRWNCPWQVPVYTLRRGPGPGSSGGGPLRCEPH